MTLQDMRDRIGGGTLFGSRIARAIALALLAVAALVVAINWPTWQLRANMASGYGARMICACRYIEGRDMKSCRSDFKGLEMMWTVRLSEDATSRTIHGSIPLLASRKATFKPGFGCLPDAP